MGGKEAGLRRGAFLGVGAVLLAASVVVAARAATSSWRPGPNVFVNRPGHIDANNSPSLARNPRHPDNLVLTHRVDRPAFSAVLQSSMDGGRSWHPTALPLPDGLDRPFAPDAAFGADGTLYVTYVNLVGNGNAPDNLWLATSRDGGRSLSDPVRIAGRLAFQARVAVAPDGTVHVTWLQAAGVANLRIAGAPNPVVASRSTDGGRTFSAPVQVSDPDRERVGAATPVVDTKGRLVVLYQDFRDDRRDFEFLEGPPWDGTFALVLTRSGDGGQSFSRGVEVEPAVVPARRFLVFLPEFPSIAAGDGDTVYVAWADGRNGDEDVFVRRSGDGGLTWRPPVRVNDNRFRDGTDQYLPRIAVAPSGRVDVVFLDRRRDAANVMTDAFFASSSDEARSFRNVRVSPRSFTSREGPEIHPVIGVDFGSRLGIVSSDSGSVVAWTDTRLAAPDSARQDVAAAAVTRRAPSRVPWLLATALALLGAAAVWSAFRSYRLRAPPKGVTN